MENGNDIMVSVIMLTYNHEAYIKKALESVINQEVDFNYEILIGDDASSDKTPEILQIYKDYFPDKIKLILRSENVGCTANLADLYKRASGRYLAHLEGDDYWTDSKKLQHQFDCLENNPQFSAVTHRFIIVDEKDEIINKKLSWVTDKPVYTARDFDGLSLPGQTATLFQRNIFLNDLKSLEIFYADRNVADRISILLLLRHGNITCLDRTMSAYRFLRGGNNQNISSTIYASGEGVLTDIRLLSVMMDYAEKEKIRFKIIKAKQLVFSRALLHYLKSDSDTRKKIKEAMVDFSNKPVYILTFWLCILRYIIYRFRSRLPWYLM